MAAACIRLYRCGVCGMHGWGPAMAQVRDGLVLVLVRGAAQAQSGRESQRVRRSTPLTLPTNYSLCHRSFTRHHILTRNIHTSFRGAAAPRVERDNNQQQSASPQADESAPVFLLLLSINANLLRSHVTY